MHFDKDRDEAIYPGFSYLLEDIDGGSWQQSEGMGDAQLFLREEL